MPLRYGFKTWRRMGEVMGAMTKIKTEVLGEKQAWYLNNMVVAQDIRGSGVGSKILSEQLQSVVLPSGFPAILMTQRPINIKFYQKLGFEIAHESIIGKGKNKFTNWCLTFNMT